MDNTAAQEKPLSLKNAPDLNEDLLSWKGPSHPYKKRDRVFYQTVLAFTFLLVAIVFFLNEFLLVAVILSMAFLVYAISTVPPVEVENKITPMGISHAGRFFKWQELSSFWFEQKWNLEILVIKTHLPFPGQVRAVVNSDIRQKVKDTVGKYLLYHDKPLLSASDKIAAWLSKKIILDQKKTS